MIRLSRLTSKPCLGTYRRSCCAARSAYVAALFAVIFGSASLHAGDHLDGPALTNSGDLDIAGLYAFQSPIDAENLVLIMTLSPFAGVLSPLEFRSDDTSFGRYSFRIDDNGDAFADVIYDVDFSTAGGARPNYMLSRNGVELLATRIETTTVLPGGGLVRAGLFDDPFFFDLNGFQDGSNFTGEDFYAGAFVLGIVLEVPAAQISSNNNLGIWATTDLVESSVAMDTVTRFDRVGRPAFNLLLIPPGRNDEFNQATPDDDSGDFGADVQASIESLNGGDQGHAMALTSILLPDILTVDVTSSAGFLNGRQLQDDVMDALLNLLTQGAVTSDAVGANDKAFKATFPYLPLGPEIFKDGFE